MKISYAIFAFCGLLCADVPINTDKILKHNQAVVFNAKTNTISYMLEITRDGKVIKRFLSDEEKKNLMQSLNLGANKNVNQGAIPNTQKEQSDESKIKSIQSAEPTIDKYPDSHIKEWDKSKIIYEQVVDKIDILR